MGLRIRGVPARARPWPRMSRFKSWKRVVSGEHRLSEGSFTGTTALRAGSGVTNAEKDRPQLILCPLDGEIPIKQGFPRVTAAEICSLLSPAVTLGLESNKGVLGDRGIGAVTLLSPKFSLCHPGPAADALTYRQCFDVRLVTSPTRTNPSHHA